MKNNYRWQKVSFLLVFLGSLVGIVALALVSYYTLMESRHLSWSFVLSLAGMLCMMLMLWQCSLGIRPVTSAWIKDFFWVNGLHKWLGIGTFATLILHPVAAVVSYGVSRGYIFWPETFSMFEVRVSFGRIGLILTLVILITSMLSRRILSFRKWHWLHLLAYPVMIVSWIHAFKAGTLINSYAPLYRYWIGVGISILTIMLARVAYRLGFLKMKSKVLSHISVSSDVDEITFQLPRAVDYTHGQFAYLQFKRGGEAHPFTILSYDAQTRTMKIAYKVVGAFTQELNRKKNLISELFIDGPYGNFTSEVDAQAPIVCIAGGIGITPFYQLLTMSKKSNAQLIYLNKSPEEAVYLSDLDDSLQEQLVCVFSRSESGGPHYKHKSYTHQRLSKKILKEILPANYQEISYYLCGSKAVIESTKNLLLSLGISVSRIHWEPFEM